MANNRLSLESLTRNLKLNVAPELQIQVGGVHFALNAELLASKSSKIDAWLKENNKDDICDLLQDLPSDPETIELVARFCHGYPINLSPENVLHVACLAHYLGMTEEHSRNNLLNKALNFLDHQVLSSWNKSIRALKAPEKILQQAMIIGLLDNCVESLIRKALENPRLLGEPIMDSASNQENDGNENMIRPSVSRKLFASDWHCEELITLSPRLYEPIIQTMVQRQVPIEYVSASIYKYARKWVVSRIDQWDDKSTSSRNFQREIIEAVERILPKDRGSLPCTLLFELLYCAMALDASSVCKNGFEERIGKQLDQATIQDLLIPFQGYATEERYDTDCLRRILKSFYNNYNVADNSGLVGVAQLMVGFLAEVASDRDLKLTTFLALAELATAASSGVQQNCDAIYEAVDIYLEKHSYLTMSEREDVCKVVDCNKLSREAREHAAVNAKLPLRLVMQVLFVGQLHLRETIPKDAQEDQRLVLQVEEGENEGDGDLRGEMEKMNSKVMELERECQLMRREIQRANVKKVQGGKLNVWKEMKRKFGCITSKNDCSCHVKKKKVHPR